MDHKGLIFFAICNCIISCVIYFILFPSSLINYSGINCVSNQEICSIIPNHESAKIERICTLFDQGDVIGANAPYNTTKSYQPLTAAQYKLETIMIAAVLILFNLVINVIYVIYNSREQPKRRYLILFLLLIYVTLYGEFLHILVHLMGWTTMFTSNDVVCRLHHECLHAVCELASNPYYFDIYHHLVDLAQLCYLEPYGSYLSVVVLKPFYLRIVPLFISLLHFSLIYCLAQLV